MTDASKPASFIAAMKDFFGLGKFPDGRDKKLTDFNVEIKALSPEDRKYFMNGLRQNGYPIPQDAA